MDSQRLKYKYEELAGDKHNLRNSQITLLKVAEHSIQNGDYYTALELYEKVSTIPNISENFKSKLKENIGTIIFILNENDNATNTLPDGLDIQDAQMFQYDYRASRNNNQGFSPSAIPNMGMQLSHGMPQTASHDIPLEDTGDSFRAEAQSIYKEEIITQEKEIIKEKENYNRR